jgi:hypothetical protein
MEVSGQLHAPAALPPGKRFPVPTVLGLDVVEKRKVSYPCRESNPDYSTIQPVF